MSKMLPAPIRELSRRHGAPLVSRSQSTEPAAPRRSAFFRIWPTLAILSYVLMIAVGVLGDFAAQAGLVSAAQSFWAFWVFSGVALLFTGITEGLQRLKLIDKSKSSDSLLQKPVVVRAPPPINEPAPAERAPAKPHAIGGALPGTISGGGRTASWRLEGDFDWRAPGDDTTDLRR